MFPCFDDVASNPGVVLELVAHQHQKATYRLNLDELVPLDVEYLSLYVVYHVLDLTYASQLFVHDHAAKNVTVADLIDGVLFGLRCYELVEGSALG